MFPGVLSLPLLVFIYHTCVAAWLHFHSLPMPSTSTSTMAAASTKRRRTRMVDTTTEHRSRALQRPSPILIATILASFVVVPGSPFGIGGIHASNPAQAASRPALGNADLHGGSSLSRTAAGPRARPSSELVGSDESRGTSRSLPSLFSVSTSTSSASPSSSQSAQIADEQHHTVTTIDNNQDWKAGECNATLISKLMYTYVDELLDVSAERKLEQSDAFRVPKRKLMKNAVMRLETRYSKARNKARRKLQQLQAEVEDGEMESINGNVGRGKQRRKKPRKRDRLATSQTIVLAKALAQSQKQTLLLTGALRLLNTAVQSFPALLIARLLRQIEAGATMHPSQPLRTAAALVGILSVKMVVENAYFHNVVKCACEVRGALAGMIFDKSMVLPNTGGGLTSTSSKDDKNANGEESNGSTKKAATTATSGGGSGEVLNLVQTDTATIESLTMQLHTIWDGLLQITLYTTLLYRYLGTAVLYGIAVLLTTIPVNSVVLRTLNKLTKQENAAKDERFKRTTEAISNMKLLKLFGGWETVFSSHIEETRDEQMKRKQKKGSVRAINQAFSNAVPVISLVVTLGHYAKSGKPIVASTIFASISLFNQLRFPLFFYPMLIDSLANGKEALKRIATYLAREELTPYVQHLPKTDEGGSIELRNGNFLWSAANQPDVSSGEQSMGAPALYDASLNVAPGEVVAVVGSVATGKTALCKSLIGELAPVPRVVVDQTNGDGTKMSFGTSDVPSVVVRGKVSYAAQEAWVPQGSLRDAVLFGREYDEEKYATALYDAGLEDDIANGPLSHEMDVGEDGSNLSGGQRARVALARALYDDSAGVVILDDVLAALDASVGSMVFERVVKRLRKQKAATIFVTNDDSLPRMCDKVILMANGPGNSQCSRVLDAGTYDELVARGHDLRSFCHPELQIEGKDAKDDGQEESSTSSNGVVIGANLDFSSRNTTQSDCHADPDCKVQMEQDPKYMADHVIPQSIEPAEYTDADASSTDEKPNESPSNEAKVTALHPPKERKQVSMDDEMKAGAVPRSTYMTYFRAIRSPLLICAALGAYFAGNAAQMTQQLIIAKWSEVGKAEMAQAVSSKYLNQLAWGAGLVSIFYWLRSYLTMRVGIRASRFIHEKMVESVFKAPLSYFSKTPSGQLLSRFGRELDVVDGVPDGISSVLFCFLQIFFSILALAGAVTPLMLFPLGFVGILYAKTMGKFRPAARDLKRSESKSRSPIYTHFREALKGVETIRVFPGSRSLWQSKHQHLTDDNLSVFYSIKALDRWLSVRLETLGNVVVFAAAVTSIFLSRAGYLKSGKAGWGITQSLSITGLLSWAVRTITESESSFMSVQRCAELTNLDSTAAQGLDGTEEGKSLAMPTEYDGAEALTTLYPEGKSDLSVPLAPPGTELVKSGWPWKGSVKVNNVSMRYNPSAPLVLKNVTASVPSGTTLGIVGRTGSGKSSLLLTLFRLVEIEGGSGSITIDGIDIRSLNLHGLRDSLSIIPQDPTLFSGTLYYNLDATGKASNKEAWDALEAASPELARQFRDGGDGLDTVISEGGENFSVGQRQLICLARALLKRSKVLVMDEATSSVDTKTDAQVQETIRREFIEKNGATVITIAHRLNVVLGYDRIVVLDDGEVVECGSPDELLRKRQGYLRMLVDADKKKRQQAELLC